MTTVYLLIPLAFLGYLGAWRIYSTRKRHPPGPLKLPILGNALVIPTNNPWFKFTEWKARYGDIIYLEALGQKVLVLNSAEVTHDLMEKRGRVSSGRPVFTMLGELMGLDKSIALRQSDPTWKYQRKLCHNLLSSDSVRDYASVQKRAIALFLRKSVIEKADFIEELRLATGRIIMSVTYGYQLYIADAEKTLKLSTESVALQRAVKWLPHWVPFNSIPHVASSAMSQGTAPLSFTREWLEEARSSSDNDDMAKNEENIMWLSEQCLQTFCSTLWFILAMALYPDIFPTFEDREKLPYLEATIKEVFRWRPPLPMAIAHKLDVDEVYRDYLIPKDTIVIPNVWAISRDYLSGFPSEEFCPERFLDNKTMLKPLDPYSYAFGFGRRVCPGKYFGDNNLYFFITGLLMTATITRKQDAEGNPLPLNQNITRNFSVVFSPRPSAPVLNNDSY
ncbi:cytochrome P450 [Cyathus striatus]|nr:cytochrome P450 [Cyathus striatus]